MGASVFVISPLVQTLGSHPLWTGPTVPVLGPLDVTHEELSVALFQSLRLTAVALAAAVYALLLDHDRLFASPWVARRSAPPGAPPARPRPAPQRGACGACRGAPGGGGRV